MKVNKLKDLLNIIPLNRIAFKFKDIECTYNIIVDIIDLNKNIIERLRFSKVAIKSTNNFETIKLIFLLDGEVTGLLFIPDDINEVLKSKYYEDAKINYEVFLENDEIKINVINEKIENSYENTHWIIPTSGTTNTPKLIYHTLDSLTRTTKKDIEKGTRYRWGLTYDINRFAGIQVFLQSVLSGSTLIIPDDKYNISSMLKEFIANNCNALSATPTFWRKAMMTQEIDYLKLDIISMGGEIADENIIKALRSKFPNAKITHIYASTEAGACFSVNDGHAGFPKSYLDNGINNVTLKISTKNTLLIKCHDLLRDSYIENNLLDNEGFIDTGDLVEVKGDRVYFLGRDSGAINVGGNKVIPEEVELALLNSGFVSSAYVYPKKNPFTGNIVCANVVLKEHYNDLDVIKEKIIEHCKKSLDAFKIPAIIKFVNELDTTNTSKVKRNYR